MEIANISGTPISRTSFDNFVSGLIPCFFVALTFESSFVSAVFPIGRLGFSSAVILLVFVLSVLFFHRIPLRLIKIDLVFLLFSSFFLFRLAMDASWNRQLVMFAQFFLNVVIMYAVGRVLFIHDVDRRGKLIFLFSSIAVVICVGYILYVLARVSSASGIINAFTALGQSQDLSDVRRLRLAIAFGLNVFACGFLAYCICLPKLSWKFLLSVLGLIAAFVLIMANDNRGSIMSGVLTVIVMSTLHIVIKRKYHYLWLALGALGGLIVFLPTMVTIMKEIDIPVIMRIVDIYSYFGENESIMRGEDFRSGVGIRVFLQDLAVRRLPENVIFGPGMGDFNRVLSFSANRFGTNAILTDYPHNIVLDVLLVSGIVGTSAFIFVMVTALKYVFQANYDSGNKWAVVFISCLFMWFLFHHQVSFFISHGKALMFASGAIVSLREMGREMVKQKVA